MVANRSNAKGEPMYSNLLVPTDGSKLSDKAVTQAIALAQALKAKITAFHASADYPMPVYAEGVSIQMMTKRDYLRQAKAEAQKILDRVVTKAAAAGVDCDTVNAIAAAPWEGILACAKKARCDAIVMASHGHKGLTALLLGSETTKVLTHSKIPVLVVR
jgi:nucleotide-binding universal stress UspA family protein